MNETHQDALLRLAQQRCQAESGSVSCTAHELHVELMLLAQSAKYAAVEQLRSSIRDRVPLLGIMEWELDSYSNDDGTHGTTINLLTLKMEDGKEHFLELESDFDEYLDQNGDELVANASESTDEDESELDVQVKAIWVKRGIPDIKDVYEHLRTLAYLAQSLGDDEVFFEDGHKNESTAPVAHARTGDSMWIMHVPVLSTEHLTAQTLAAYGSSSENELKTVQMPDGFMVFLSDETCLEGVPEDLAQCLRWNLARGGDWLRFDQDGDIVPELTTYLHE